MALWDTLKAAIDAVITANGNNEITGTILNQTLDSIVDNVGENATYKGVASPSTTPGTPDGPVFYIASKAGTYSNFGGLVLSGQPATLYWSGSSWVSGYLGSIELKHSADISTDLAYLQSILSIERSRYGQDDLINATRVISADGTTVSASTVKSTNFIPIRGAEKILVTLPISSVDAGLAFYDSNQDYISGVVRNGSTGYSLEEIEVPANAEYLKTCFWKDGSFVDDVRFILKLMGVRDTGSDLLKTQFRLITGADGFVSILEDGTVQFSYLYLIDSESGKRIYLTDGTNAYNSVNSITPDLFDSLYISLTDFVNTAANDELGISRKIWTTLSDGEISLGITMSLTDKKYQFGEIFSISDKRTIDSVQESITLSNSVPEDSLLDENTELSGDDSAGQWDIRYDSDANNYVNKLTDEPEDYFKISINSSGGANPAFWMLNVIPRWVRNTTSRVSFYIKGDSSGTVKLNTDGGEIDIPITTDWVKIERDVIFGEVYNDMRFMFYTATNVIFYVKNIELIPTAIANKIESLENNTIKEPNAVNTEKLPVVLSKFGDILFENSGVLDIGLFGDSWTQGVGSVATGLISYAKYIARIMWEKYGYAGLGWFDFGYSNSTDMMCADDEEVTYTKSGTLTYIAKTAGSLGINIAHTEMSIGAYYNLAFDQSKQVDKAVIWFYNDASFEYQVNGGSAVTVNADSVSGWQSVTINAAITELKITALTNNTIVFGVDLSYGTTGVKIHKLGCRGLTTAQAVAVDEVNWKQGIQALNLDFFSSLLFTNDRSTSIPPSNVVSNTQELLSRVLEAYPNIIDVAILCPSETQGGTGTYPVKNYVDLLREYAITNEVPFASLVPVFGTPDQIAALGTFYDSLHPSKKGDYLISEFLFKNFFEYHQYN